MEPTTVNIVEEIFSQAEQLIKERDYWYACWYYAAVLLVQQQQLNLDLLEEMGRIDSSDKPTVH